MLGVGLWMFLDPSIVKQINVVSVLDNQGNFIKYASYVMMGVGAFVFIVGFLGCCGALTQKMCPLITVSAHGYQAIFIVSSKRQVRDHIKKMYTSKTTLGK